MNRCPRFNTCNAPLCPCDPQWKTRTQLAEDATCRWVTAALKKRTGRIPPEVPRQAIKEILPLIRVPLNVRA